MAAHRTPRWSAGEVAILRDVYAREGLDAAMADWQAGKISRLEACRLIRRGGLVSA